MKRYNLQAFGNVETFLEKIPRKQKSLVVNSIISNALKSNKIKEILMAFFTDKEIKELFADKKDDKTPIKEEKIVNVDEEESSSFKVKI